MCMLKRKKERKKNSQNERKKIQKKENIWILQERKEIQLKKQIKYMFSKIERKTIFRNERKQKPYLVKKESRNIFSREKMLRKKIFWREK